MEGRARNGQVELAWEAVGPDGGSVVLLVAGAGSDSVTWPRVLVDGLAAGGHRVVLFDPRDTGRSTWVTPDGPAYTLDDMAADALAVLDDVGAADAHVVGRSLGGFVAQVVALRAPERVRSLTLVYTSADMRAPGRGAYSEEAAARTTSDPGDDPDAQIAHMVTNARGTWGSGHPFEEERETEVARRRVARGYHRWGARGHGAAARGAPSRTAALASLSVPTLVVHGDEDPLVPHDHGVALAEAIPGARLVTMHGVGHALPTPVVETLVLPAMLDLFRAADDLAAAR